MQRNASTLLGRQETQQLVDHFGKYAGKPVPSRQAAVEEMDALVSVMGELKRGLMQITIGRDFSTRHMAEVSRKYQIPVTWTALLSHLYGPGGHRKQLDLAAEQRKSGAIVIPQVSCRPLNFEVTFAEPFIFDVMKFMNELAVADAHPLGARPFGREQYRDKFTTLAEGVVAPAEQDRFLAVVDGLAAMKPGSILINASRGTVVEVGDGIAQIYGLSGALSSELLEFPGGGHDDQVDALAYGVHVFLRLARGGQAGGRGGGAAGYDPFGGDEHGA